jgi:hypothetical protein
MSSTFHFEHHKREALATKRRFSGFTAALAVVLVTVVGIQYHSVGAAQTTNPYAGSCSNPAGTQLSYGSSGGCVSYAQWDLDHPVNAGAANPAVSIDGKFGSATKTAVINYQNARKLSADGVIGSNTWAQLLAKPTINLLGNGVATALTINKNDPLAISWATGNTSVSGYPSCTGGGRLSGATGVSGNINKHNDDLVGATTTLTYSISCSNTNGSAADSVAVKVNVAAISTPTLSSNGNPTATSIPLKWTASTTSSPATLKTYTLHNKSNGGSYGTTAPTVSYTVTGLAACTTYSFDVNSTNSQTTNSALSATVTIATIGCAPAATPAPTTRIATPTPTPVPPVGGTSGSTTGGSTGSTTGQTSPSGGAPKSIVPAPKPGVVAQTQPTAVGGPAADTTPPTAPDGFTAVVSNSGSVVSLSWISSTDAGGIKGYNIERSADQQVWNTLQSGITATSYDDKTVVFSTHYYYRITATDAVGNTSDYSLADTTTTAYQPNTGSGDAKLTSDDGTASVVIPDGAIPSGADCSVTTGDAEAPVTKTQVRIAGPYQLLCKDADGNTIASFTKAITWSYVFKNQLTGYSSPIAVTVDDSGKAAAAKSRYNAKTKIMSFNQTTGSQTFILASKKKPLPVNLIVGILFVMGIFAGAFFFVLRRRQQSNYSEYIRSKYYDI